MADISKRIEKAEKFLKKGKVDSALEEYLSVLDHDPGNDKIRHVAADLFLQINRGAEAASLLSELFDRQVAAGDNARAALTFKKLARISPPKLGQVLRFAQASERSGNRREALEAYDAAVKGFLREGRENEALSALRRMVGIQPERENLKRLADLAAKLRDGPAAAEAFLKIGLAEEQNGQKGFSWYERAHQQDPENPEIAFRFGKHLLEKGEIERAVHVLERAAKAKVSLPEHRQAYGYALIHLFQLRYAAGDFGRAADALARAADVDPYVEGLARRLELLQGKIDANRYRAIASHLKHAETEPPDSTKHKDKDKEISKDAEEGDQASEKESTVLEDLMLQAEIFLQYAMRAKA